MATQQDYATGIVLIDGRKLVQVESWNTEIESGQQPVVLLNEGLGGFTPGGGQTNIGLTVFVPIGGFEEPIDDWTVEGSYHTIQIGLGPKAQVTRGKFMNVKIGQSTGDAVKFETQFVGEKKAFK
jgi:hypothetical protein